VALADIAEDGMILGQVAGDAVLLARRGQELFAIGAESINTLPLSFTGEEPLKGGLAAEVASSFTPGGVLHGVDLSGGSQSGASTLSCRRR
jgi:hypothetical protein